MPVLHPFHHRSLLEGAEVEIFKLLAYGATPEQWAGWLRAPLEHAAARGNLNLVQRLLKAGANGGAGWRGCRGRTLLDAAALGGNEDVVTALLQAGCVPDVRVVSVSSRRSALHLSVVCGHQAVAIKLMLAGAGVNYRDPADKCCPLHVAVAGGHEDLVRDLLIGGGCPTSRDLDGFTPLHIAAKLGKEKIVTTLLGTPSTEKDALSGGGLSPLMWASRKGHLATVKVLLAAGADLTLRTDLRLSHRSALDFAAVYGRDGVIKAILKHGADVNAANHDGKTALHCAATSKKAVKAVRVLLDAGAGVDNKKIHHGSTPLHIASSLTYVKTMRALLRRAANVNETTTEGYTPLFLTCLYQRSGVSAAVDLLLRWGASETAADNNGETPAGVLQRRANRRQCSADEAERVRVLLVRAPADRAWRRRCWLVMLRARAEKERMTQYMGNSSGEVGLGDRRGGEDADSKKTARADDGSGSRGRAGVGGGNAVVSSRESAAEEGGLSDLVAALMGLELDEVFRTIVSYL